EPYLELTCSMLRQCGIGAVRRGDDCIVVAPAPPRLPRIAVEADASSMSYFLGLAAVTGTTVEVPGIAADSAQGDVGFLRVLERMGCTVEPRPDRLRLRGARELRGVDVDLGAMPDVALTLAAVAARAQGPTRIANVAHLRVKESDRLAAAAAARAPR